MSLIVAIGTNFNCDIMKNVFHSSDKVKAGEDAVFLLTENKQESRTMADTLCCVYSLS